MEAQELKALLKETICEVLQEERLALCQALIPYISEREMQEIQERLGSPSNYDKAEFVNMTNWVRNGSQL